MKYAIITTKADGQQTANIIDVATAMQAYHTTRTASGATLRVYPITTDAAGMIDADGVARGALLVARCTARNGIRRTGGNDTQRRIDNDLRRVNARAMRGGGAHQIASYIADTSADAQDYYSIAQCAIVAAVLSGQDIMQQYAAAYAALNNHVMQQRAASHYEISTEFLRDNNDDLIAINRVIASIMRGDNRYAPIGNGTMSTATTRRLGYAIHCAMAYVTPIQRDIINYVTCGYSQRDIAVKLHRSVTTINRHIAIIRKTISDFITNNYPEFVYLIITDGVDDSAEAACSGGAKDAAYYRAYRARRKAAQQPR